jgi:hypothetical protein
MSGEIGIPSDNSLAVLHYVGLLVAALLGLVLTMVAIRKRRGHAEQSDQNQSSARSSEQLETENEVPDVPDDDDEDLKRAFITDTDDLKLDDIPAFTSLLDPNERHEPVETDDTASKIGSAGDVSSLLFRLLGTKARISELERAEQSKSRVLESTYQALERLKGSLQDSSPELKEEIEEMHELIAEELTASRQSLESVLNLKEIIETQCDLLKQPDAIHSAEFLSAKQSHVETIDASLDRRLKSAERREIEIALGKERIMALRKQMLKVIDAQTDSAQTHKTDE